MQFGETPGLDAEALIVGEMPVEDVELDGGHGVEIAADHIEGEEVAGGIEQEAAPGETRVVVDDDGGRSPAGRRFRHELKQGFEGVEGSERVRGGYQRLMGCGFEAIGFVFVERLHGIAGGTDMDPKVDGSAEARGQASGGGGNPGFVNVRFDTGVRAENQTARPGLHGDRLRQQSQFRQRGNGKGEKEQDGPHGLS